MVRFLGAFALVIVLASLASRWLAGQARGGQRTAFSVVGAIGLGGQRQVCALRVGRRVLILGLGDKQVSLLETITDPEEIALLLPPSRVAPPSGGGAGPAGRGFSSVLARSLAQGLRRGRNGGDGDA